MIGTQLGQYLIESPLGAGGMGVVYRAFDSRLERQVAIKLFSSALSTPQARHRLMHEARSASALNHPNVCTIHEVGESGDTLYLVMEFVEGRTLTALIPADGLPVGAIIHYGSQIAAALAHAHERGVVHRDLKCANVVITPEGHAKVLDFGIAQRQLQNSGAESRTHTQNSFLAPGHIAGTLSYMSPEALRGEVVDGRADIWALGVMLYQMATARLPFAGDTSFDLTGKILHAPAPPLPDHVSPGLRAVVARCLAKDRAQRYSNASELRGALDAVQSSQMTGTGPVLGVTGATIEQRTLLVLPFSNMAGDAESDYFADGLTEEVITDLSNLGQLRVISRTSSMQFKNTTQTVAELAKELHVEHVLEGSVRRVGNALRITAKLIEAATDSTIWGHKYNGSLEDVFAIQETLSRSIVDALRVVLTAEEERQLKQHPIADVRAYEWYLRAKQGMLRFTKESLDAAIECLEQSEAIVGDNVLVLAAKGETYWQYVNSGVSADPAYLDKADACARRVLEMEPGSPHGLRIAGLVRVHRGDLQGSLQQLKHALDLEPNNPDCLVWGSIVAGLSGKMALADAWADRLVDIDPVTPFFQLVPGTMAWLNGDYERAWAQWSEHTSAVMDNPLMRLVYGHLAVITGRTSEGERLLDALARDVPDSSFGQLAAVYQWAFKGDRERALAGLTPELIAALEGDPQYCWFVAQCHALVGDVDGGIRWIEAAVSRGFINHGVLSRFDPFLANLRTDPRFDTLMHAVKLRGEAIAI